MTPWADVLVLGCSHVSNLFHDPWDRDSCVLKYVGGGGAIVLCIIIMYGVIMQLSLVVFNDLIFIYSMMGWYANWSPSDSVVSEIQLK